MSEYQARKARMLELQREKEEELKRELSAKAAKEKQLAKEAEDLRKRQEAAAKEARRLELMKANEALNKKINGEQGKKEMEYDPFAEDARPAPAAIKPTAKPTTKLANSKAGPSRTNTSSKQSVPGPSASSKSNGNHPRNHAKQKAQSNSPPPLGRKERAAKAFAQSAKKNTNDSLFSIRSLVESRDSGAGSAPLSRSNSAGQLGSIGSYNGGGYNGYKGNSNNSISIHGIGMSNGLKRDPNQPKLIQGVKQKSGTRQMLANQAKMDGLRTLCPDRATRDRRSIEEIQRDIKAKRGLGQNGSGDISPVPTLSSQTQQRTGNGKSPPKREGRDRSPIRGKPSSSSSIIPKWSSSISRNPVASSSLSKIRQEDRQRPIKRRPSSSTSGDSSDSDSDSDNGRRPIKKKSYSDPYGRGKSPPIRLNENSSHMDIRAEIQNLFRRPGAAPPRRRYEDEFSDSGSEDMEAGLSDVEEEERRTARIARREDELAEKQEREHKLAKLKKKKELEKLKAKR
ncbi:uncharacterized protein L201_004312 [Kwoniella dendrophila CBS 6074]|uniref:Protein SPT2 n=1 Tax=Kwoniella dendrophila CBS 6074 TaxID=1295534 RepID=A0AAX4JWW6_9TREE